MKKVSLRKRMCEPCGLAWQAWLDYRLPPPPIQLITIGHRVRDVSDRQEARYREWRDTVRFQQDLIEQICLRGRHVYRRGPGGEPAAPALRYQSLPSL